MRVEVGGWRLEHLEIAVARDRVMGARARTLRQIRGK